MWSVLFYGFLFTLLTPPALAKCPALTERSVKNQLVFEAIEKMGVDIERVRSSRLSNLKINGPKANFLGFCANESQSISAEVELVYHDGAAGWCRAALRVSKMVIDSGEGRQELTQVTPAIVEGASACAKLASR